jgi:hypothetical protein
MQLILSFFITISTALLVVGTHSKMRRLAMASVYLSEQHEYALNRILHQDTISILNVDYQEFRPPYLTEFCKEIRTIMEENEDSPIKMLETIEDRFRKTAYTPLNFPRTYRQHVPVVVTTEDLDKYNKKYCGSQLKEHQPTGPILFFIVFTAVMILFMFIHK